MGSQLRKTWQNMKQRCQNPNAPSYQYYGGRGITVCERWRSFANFAKDMGERPSTKHSLDRIDNDKGYCPENCRWATQAEQCDHRTSKTMLTLEGTTLPMRTWALRIGMNPMTLYSRVMCGWEVEKVLTIPTCPNRRRQDDLSFAIMIDGKVGDREFHSEMSRIFPSFASCLQAWRKAKQGIGAGCTIELIRVSTPNVRILSLKK